MEDKDKTVRWDEIKRKIWFEQTKARAAAKAKQFGEWVVTNPVATGTSAACIYKGVRSLTKAYSVHREDVRRDTDFYDPRAGKHSYARRKPTRREQVEIDDRYSRGESYTKILYDMGLLR